MTKTQQGLYFTPLGWLTILVTLLFVTLQDVGSIHWSWWWVFSPILIVWGFWLVLLATSTALHLLVARQERRH